MLDEEIYLTEVHLQAFVLVQSLKEQCHYHKVRYLEESNYTVITNNATVNDVKTVSR